MRAGGGHYGCGKRGAKSQERCKAPFFADLATSTLPMFRGGKNVARVTEVLVDSSSQDAQTHSQ